MFNKILKSVILAISFTTLLKADDSVFNNNIDVLSHKTKIEAAQLDIKLAQGLYYPEISINTGLGSEYTKDKTETEKGPYLFLETKLNIYRGGRDLREENIIQNSISNLKNENNIILKKLKKNIFKINCEIKSYHNDIKLLENEINENNDQLIMAKKKLDAGLTTAADLLDFQIKKETLENEISANQLKVIDLENEILKVIGKNGSSESIKDECDLNSTKVFSAIQQENLPEIQILKNEIMNKKLEISNSKSAYLPTVDLEGKFGQITPSSPLLKNKTEHQVSINLNFPIFSGFTNDIKIAKANLESSQKEQELKQLELELTKSLENERNKILLNEKIISNLEKSFEMSSKYKMLSIFEYKKGIKNSSDVINASDRNLELKRKINELKYENKSLTFAFNTNYN